MGTVNSVSVLILDNEVFTSLLEDGEGHRMLFVMNLYSGAQSTTVTVYDRSGGLCAEETLSLGAMEVKTLDLSEELM